MRMSAPLNTASKAAVNLLSRSRIKKRKTVGVVLEIDQQVAGLLGDPGAGGVGGDPGEVYVASGVLDDDQDVEAAQEDGVDVGEADRKDRVSLRRQELPPGRAGPPGSGVDAGGRENLPDRGGRYSVAESDELRGCVGSPSWGSLGPSCRSAPEGPWLAKGVDRDGR
jgi:hypothetical protein